MITASSIAHYIAMLWANVLAVSNSNRPVFLRYIIIQIYNCRNERVAGTSSCKQRDVMKGQALRDFLKDPNSVGKVVTLSDGGKATVSRIQPCADSLDGN